MLERDTGVIGQRLRTGEKVVEGLGEPGHELVTNDGWADVLHQLESELLAGGCLQQSDEIAGVAVKHVEALGQAHRGGVAFGVRVGYKSCSG